MTKEFYAEPSIKITHFLTQNLITTSGEGVIDNVRNGRIKVDGKVLGSDTEIVTFSL